MIMNNKLLILLHSIGLASLFATAILSIFVFAGILVYGSVRLIEPITPILIAEFIMSIIAVIYFGYVYKMVLKELCAKQKRRQKILNT